MNIGYEVTLKGPQGTSAKIAFSLEEALGAMKKWEEKTDGRSTITGIELSIWLLDAGNQMTMISIMYELIREKSV